MKRVEGRVAIVTGSTYGIGEAIVKVLAKKGEISIITGRRRRKEEDAWRRSMAMKVRLSIILWMSPMRQE
jgi:NAD(P)-dependent dehydrogenase (short-subunit alcohol dehydrogenase family)